MQSFLSHSPQNYTVGSISLEQSPALSNWLTFFMTNSLLQNEGERLSTLLMVPPTPIPNIDASAKACHRLTFSLINSLSENEGEKSLVQPKHVKQKQGESIGAYHRFIFYQEEDKDMQKIWEIYRRSNMILISIKYYKNIIK